MTWQIYVTGERDMGETSAHIAAVRKRTEETLRNAGDDALGLVESRNLQAVGYPSVPEQGAVSFGRRLRPSDAPS